MAPRPGSQGIPVAGSAVPPGLDPAGLKLAPLASATLSLDDANRRPPR
jgi:hypothetical protein